MKRFAVYAAFAALVSLCSCILQDDMRVGKGNKFRSLVNTYEMDRRSVDELFRIAYLVEYASEWEAADETGREELESGIFGDCIVSEGEGVVSVMLLNTFGKTYSIFSIEALSSNGCLVQTDDVRFSVKRAGDSYIVRRVYGDDTDPGIVFGKWNIPSDGILSPEVEHAYAYFMDGEDARDIQCVYESYSISVSLAEGLASAVDRHVHCGNVRMVMPDGDTAVLRVEDREVSVTYRELTEKFSINDYYNI